MTIRKILPIIFTVFLVLLAGCTVPTLPGQKTQVQTTNKTLGVALEVYPTSIELYPGEKYNFSIIVRNDGKVDATNITVKPMGTAYVNGSFFIEKLPPGEYETIDKNITISAPEKISVTTVTTFKIVAEYDYSSPYDIFFCLRNITRRDLNLTKEGICSPNTDLKINQIPSPVQIVSAKETLAYRKDPTIVIAFEISNNGDGNLVGEDRSIPGKTLKYVIANLTMYYGPNEIGNINENCSKTYSPELGIKILKVDYVNKSKKTDGLKVYLENGKGYILCQFKVDDIVKMAKDKNVTISSDALKLGIKDALIRVNIMYRYRTAKDIKATFIAPEAT